MTESVLAMIEAPCDVIEIDTIRWVDGYHAWRGAPQNRHSRESGNPEPYQDIAGFFKSATTEEIATHGHVLTPGRYVGAEEVVDEGEPFEEKMPRLVAELNAQFEEAANLEQAIRANLRGLGYGD